MGAKDSKNMDKLLDVSIELKMQAKLIQKDYQKQAAQAAAQKKQVKQYVIKGDVESAKMVAQEAIRQEKQARNLHRLSLRMGGLASKLESAYRTSQVTEQIAHSVPLIKSSLKSMEKMGVLKTMSEFEGVFDELNVQTANIDSALDEVYGSGIPQAQVNELIEKVQAEAGMDVEGEMGGAAKKHVKVAGQEPQVENLESRLAKLKDF